MEREQIMQGNIRQICREEFSRCANIWDFERHRQLADLFYRQLLDGNRTILVYEQGKEFVGEVALVREMDDPDDTIAGKRAYLSHLIVVPRLRNRGIGKALVAAVVELAKKEGFLELSLGVDADNAIALSLYRSMGFTHELFHGTDQNGEYYKLLKML